jgi:hypothetical protein
MPQTNFCPFVSLDGRRCEHRTPFLKIRGKPLLKHILGHFAELGCSSGMASVAERIQEDHIDPWIDAGGKGVGSL